MGMVSKSIILIDGQDTGRATAVTETWHIATDNPTTQTYTGMDGH